MNIQEMLTHWLLPHRTNNHKARVLHVDALFVYVIGFLVFNLFLRVVHQQYPTVLGYATDIHTEQLLSATNQKRVEAGLQPLVMNEELSQAAMLKAQDMFAKGYWAHNSPDGKTPWDFIISSGYQYTLAGENLAKNFSNSTGVIDAWMASPTHRANIVKDGYREIGFAIVNGKLNGEETTLVVQMFGTTNGTVAALPQKTQPLAQVVPTKVAVIPTGAPVVLPQVVIPKQAAVAPAPAVPTVKSAFASVIKRPLFNLPTVAREVVYLFAGIMMGVIVVDAWLVSRRKIVRVTGHSLGHLLLLGALLLLTSGVMGGSIL